MGVKERRIEMAVDALEALARQVCQLEIWVKTSTPEELLTLANLEGIRIKLARIVDLIHEVP